MGKRAGVKGGCYLVDPTSLPPQPQAKPSTQTEMDLEVIRPRKTFREECGRLSECA